MTISNGRSASLRTFTIESGVQTHAHERVTLKKCSSVTFLSRRYESPTAMAAAPTSKLRVFILTISVAAITATGAWYGAGLKIEQDYKKASRSLFVPSTDLKSLDLGLTTLMYLGGCCCWPSYARRSYSNARICTRCIDDSEDGAREEDS